MSVLSDFDWSLRGVRVRETGADIPFSLSLAHDVWRGGLYIVAEWCRQALSPKPAQITARFHPRPPRAWYLLWGALRQANIRDGGAARVDIGFSDLTHVEGLADAPPGSINASCVDISKSRVAQVFETVFGYSLALDPRAPDGPYVEKSEVNGRHDGRILTAPMEPRPGFVYQRMIDNVTEDGTVLDLRCPTVFGTVPLIYLKERPVTRRFANLNTRVRLAKPEDHLSEEERGRIAEFCRRMCLDWGGLDILRDNTDGRIYIVDVNKTDMGPPLALPLRDKLSSTKHLGRALRAAIEARLDRPTSQQKQAA